MSKEIQLHKVHNEWEDNRFNELVSSTFQLLVDKGGGSVG